MSSQDLISVITSDFRFHVLRELGKNPMRPIDEYVREQSMESLIQPMACRLFVARLLSKPIQVHVGANFREI